VAALLLLEALGVPLPDDDAAEVRALAGAQLLAEALKDLRLLREVHYEPA
jgi:hypothetical protein